MCHADQVGSDVGPHLVLSLHAALLALTHLYVGTVRYRAWQVGTVHQEQPRTVGAFMSHAGVCGGTVCGQRHLLLVAGVSGSPAQRQCVSGMGRCLCMVIPRETAQTVGRARGRGCAAAHAPQRQARRTPPCCATLRAHMQSSAPRQAAAVAPPCAAKGQHRVFMRFETTALSTGPNKTKAAWGRASAGARGRLCSGQSMRGAGAVHGRPGAWAVPGGRLETGAGTGRVAWARLGRARQRCGRAICRTK